MDQGQVDQKKEWNVQPFRNRQALMPMFRTFPEIKKETDEGPEGRARRSDRANKLSQVP